VSKARGIIAFVFVLGIFAILGYYWLLPTFFEREQLSTSDAGNISMTWRIGGDNYLGYFFLTSNEMKKQLLSRGMQVVFTDDGGDYATRLKKFADGEYDAIVLPVNSYLYHGKDHKYPGVIATSICESRDADAIIGFADRFPTGNIKELNNANLRIVYVKDSPSEFLIDLTIADFGLDQLKSSSAWRVPVGSQEEVLAKLEKHQGDAFVLWEPNVSKALQTQGVKYLWGSDKFRGYIVDGLVFHRDVIDKYLEQENSPLLAFLRTYFQTIDTYANDEDRLVEEMVSTTGLKENAVRTMMKKIEWFDLRENATLQFGIPIPGVQIANDGVITTINSCLQVMLRTKRLTENPLPNKNPYLIMNSLPLKKLTEAGVVATVAANTSGTVDFQPLDAAGWKRLREAATLRLENITFDRGTNFLDEEGKTRVDELAVLLANNYPNFRVLVRGHTSSGGDDGENMKLSQLRADVVVQRLIAVHRLNENRLRADGVGSSMPAPMRPNESVREYRYRLARVEFVLYEPNI
jgi:outer membrane protein OmpA-like peptidoglycan-associated protein